MIPCPPSPTPLLLVVALALPVSALAAADEPTGDEPAAGDETDEEAAPKRFRWVALPLVAGDTDDGIGFGGFVELQRMDPDYDPYRSSFMIHAYVSVRGYHHHRLYLDFPGLGARRQLRLRVRFAYRQWLNDGYWGLGNGTTEQRAYVGDFDKDDTRRKRYRYNLLQPYAYVLLRGDAPGKLNGFASVTLQWTQVKTYEDSLLAEQQPEGMQGGFSLQLAAGVLFDGRTDELTPHRGVMVELAARAQPHFPGGTGPFFGPFVQFRHYVPLAPPHLVLAWRVMAEWLFGDVPFYEMARWGGVVPALGFGGYDTLRGIPFGRWRAPGRAVANVELRIEVLRHKLFKTHLRWQIVPFVDVGAVWGAGELATADAPAFPLHPTAGLGIHPVLADAFQVRLDVGFSPEYVTESDGQVTSEFGWGLYLVFGPTF